MLPRVAIVGRPNVGKSTLFNRLVGRRIALVDDEPGVTRDRREGEARLGPLAFVAIDTAGLEEAPAASLSGRMRRQTDRAVKDADAVVFVIDGRAGLTPEDRHFAAWLRKSGKPIVLVANKCEGRGGEAGRLEAYRLGLGEPLAISAEHGEGLVDLHDALREALGRKGDAEEAVDEGAAKPLLLAIVGRPNVGKSTLFNAVLGEERSIVGPEAGLTRDAIAVRRNWRGRDIRLFDTAGLRKKAAVQGKIEKLSVAETLRAIRYAEVAICVLDATSSFDKQDAAVIDLVAEEGRALVVALNKWDLVEDRQRAMRAFRERLHHLASQVAGVALVPVSAAAGDGIEALMRAVFKAHDVWNKRVPTAALNRWLEGATQAHPPPLVQGRRLRIRYASQIKARPPTFALFANQPGELPDDYRRYLVNGLRQGFDLPGTPIRLSLRKSGKNNPYDPGR